MAQYHIMDRASALKSMAHKTFDCIISIDDPNTTIPQVGPHHLILEFEDRPGGFSSDMALQVLRHVKRYAPWDYDSILIHCYAGVSRSTSVAWAIMVDQGLSYQDALIKLLDLRPQADPKPWFIKSFTDLTRDSKFLKAALRHYHLSRALSQDSQLTTLTF